MRQLNKVSPYTHPNGTELSASAPESLNCTHNDMMTILKIIVTYMLFFILLFCRSNGACMLSCLEDTGGSSSPSLQCSSSVFTAPSMLSMCFWLLTRTIVTWPTSLNFLFTVTSDKTGTGTICYCWPTVGLYRVRVILFDLIY